MSDAPKMEIPAALRDMTERNVEQARNAYAQFMDMARKAQEMAMKSSGAMAEAALEVQDKAMRFTEENVEANFKLASDLARARDMKDYFDIQSRHAQQQMQTYATQAQELGRLLALAAQKAQSRS